MILLMISDRSGMSGQKCQLEIIPKIAQIARSVLADNLLSLDRRKNNNLKSYRTGRQLCRRDTVVHVFLTEAGAVQVASQSTKKQGGRNIEMHNKLDMLKQQALKSGNPRRRRLAMIAAGIGFGSVLAYLLSRLLGSAERAPEFFSTHVVDDRGTDQRNAAKILRNLRDRGFEASDEKLSLALGRPLEEVTGWTTGLEVIDDDVVMKARGIAMHRGIRVE